MEELDDKIFNNYIYLNQFFRIPTPYKSYSYDEKKVLNQKLEKLIKNYQIKLKQQNKENEQNVLKSALDACRFINSCNKQHTCKIPIYDNYKLRCKNMIDTTDELKQLIHNSIFCIVLIAIVICILISYILF